PGSGMKVGGSRSAFRRAIRFHWRGTVGGGPALDSVVIVGGGLAAARLVQGLRRIDDTIPITLVSAERHMPYDRPPLSKGYLGGTEDESRLWLVTEALWENVDIRLGKPATQLSVDSRTVTLSDGS